MHRAQIKQILKDLDKKMVFLVGPRQVGKTWMAKQLMASFHEAVYLNYDNAEDRHIIENQSWFRDVPLLVLDELHKMKDWKNFIKGVYDVKEASLKILVTASARLQTYRHVGDSLSGRFFAHHLMPFTLAELEQNKETIAFDTLLERGGFPEPLLSDSAVDVKRWRAQYVDSMISSDVNELKPIENINSMRLILALLRKRVGSCISYQSIAEDVKVAPNTVKNYISLLESLYVIFCIRPYSKNIARSLLKEPKIYFFDNGLVDGGIGAKLENWVALSLYKHALVKNDQLGESNKLHYLRTKEGKEVDFCLVNDDGLLELIEVKSSDKTVSASLNYFSKKYNVPGVQLVKSLRQEFVRDDINVQNAEKYLKQLYI